MLKDLLNFRDIANFQGGKCTFAPIYLKISAMEGEIFWAGFLSLVHLSLRWRVKYFGFGIFFYLNGVYNGVRGGFLINVPIM